jgi:hypothetical protein
LFTSLLCKMQVVNTLHTPYKYVFFALAVLEIAKDKNNCHKNGCQFLDKRFTMYRSNKLTFAKKNFETARAVQKPPPISLEICF